MATPEQVQVFLKEFFAKKKVFDIEFRNDRGKNVQALFDLELTPMQREKILDALTFEDYYRGPSPDDLNKKEDMWEFGKVWRKKVIYIKITMGDNRKPVVCISFHPAEREMKLPFKKS
jgi:hypothetical protein